jgi:hypothetical protein
VPSARATAMAAAVKGKVERFCMVSSGRWMKTGYVL